MPECLHSRFALHCVQSLPGNPYPSVLLLNRICCIAISSKVGHAQFSKKFRGIGCNDWYSSWLFISKTPLINKAVKSYDDQIVSIELLTK